MSTKTVKISVIKFVKWSLDRDITEGCYTEKDGVKCWQDLSQKERDIYIEEAKVYFGKPLSEWPEDILERL